MVAAFPFPSPQGSQVLVRGLSRRLVERGHEVALLTYGQGQHVDGEGYEHHRIRRLPGDDAMRSGPTPTKPLLDALMLTKLTALLRERPFDIIHAHNYEAAVVGLLARMRTGVPVVYHSHNLMGDELETYFVTPTGRVLARRLGGWLDRNVPRRATHTIALCEPSAAEMRDRLGVDPRRLSVIPPVVDVLGDPRPTGADAPGDGSLRVVYCGNTDAYQDLDVLVQAAVRLDGEEPPVTVVVGTHGTDRSFASRAREAGAGRVLEVVGLESSAQAAALIASADVAVLPRGAGSGYPIKLLNYMSAAKAVVTAGCGAKLVRHGIDGLVVPDDDPDALVEAFRRLRDAPEERRRLGAEGHRTWRERLSWEATLPEIERAYEQALT